MNSKILKKLKLNDLSQIRS